QCGFCFSAGHLSSYLQQLTSNFRLPTSGFQHLYFLFSEGLPEIAMLSLRRFQGTRQRQFQAKGGAASGLGLKFYPTVVQLHKPKSVSESDAGTSGTGCKKQLENFLLIVGRDSRARIC